jgi:hypothetical protein
MEKYLIKATTTKEENIKITIEADNKDQAASKFIEQLAVQMFILADDGYYYNTKEIYDFKAFEE